MFELNPQQQNAVKESYKWFKKQNNQVFEKLRKENNWPEDLTLSKVLGVYKTKDTKVVKKKSK